MPKSHHNHASCTANLILRAQKMCGTKFTSQRRDILTCVAQSHAAVGAYDVIERMAEQGSRPAPITVYRALDFLLAHNLVHKIESRNAFVACACVHDDVTPALLICEICGNVDEIVPPHATDSLKAAATATGFKVNRSVIELSGTCKDCTHV